MCRCGCIEGMKRRNLEVVLEGSEQLFRGITIYMGQKHRSVSRETEHKGGGGSGNNIRTPLRSDMHHTLFFFLTESTDFCCLINSWDWQLHMENLLWAPFYRILQWSLFWVYLTWFLKKGSAIFYHPFLHILLYKTILFHIWLYHGLKTTNSITTLDRAPIKKIIYKGQHSANYIKDTAIFSLILSVFEITIREGQKLLISKR